MSEVHVFTFLQHPSNETFFFGYRSLYAIQLGIGQNNTFTNFAGGSFKYLGHEGRARRTLEGCIGTIGPAAFVFACTLHRHAPESLSEIVRMYENLTSSHWQPLQKSVSFCSQWHKRRMYYHHVDRRQAGYARRLFGCNNPMELALVLWHWNECRVTYMKSLVHDIEHSMCSLSRISLRAFHCPSTFLITFNMAMDVETRVWSTSRTCRVDTDKPTSKIWFKTNPLDSTLIHSLTQLQLLTESHEQIQVEESEDDLSRSWFDIVILSDINSTEPLSHNGEELAWRSHPNGLVSENNKLHLGPIFDRRRTLFRSLKPGNVLGVRVYTQGQSSVVIEAFRGSLIATVNALDNDLVLPSGWALSSGIPTLDPLNQVQGGIYTVTNLSPCDLQVTVDEDDPLSACREFSQLWFTTPPLTADVLARLEEIQLLTYSHDQGSCDDPDVGSQSWFDLAIFDSPQATTPRVVDGRMFVWRSHSNKLGRGEYLDSHGQVFNQDHEIFGLLEEGHAIGVCVCAQFSGWANYAKRGYLLVRIGSKPVDRHTERPDVDFAELAKRHFEIKEACSAYLDSLTPEGEPPALSYIVGDNTRFVRADSRLGAGERPLALLSLDGGGVRGISSLYILSELMKTLTGNKYSKPCDYFDIMAGTSTGGLIAIMLGRLRMSVPDCMEAFTFLSKKIFKDGERWFFGKVLDSENTRYDERVFEKAMKDFLISKGFDKDALMYDPDHGGCKVFVLSAEAKNINNRLARHLRTYISPFDPSNSSRLKIWEAARATSAAPTFFRQATIDNEKYIDGGVSANNPVLLLVMEVARHFGPGRPHGCVVSLGTGMKPDVSISGIRDTLNPKTWIGIGTGTEATHLMAQELLCSGLIDSHYLRFNVGKKYPNGEWKEPIEIHQWDKMFQITQWTEDYLQDSKVKSDMLTFAFRMKFATKRPVSFS